MDHSADEESGDDARVAKAVADPRTKQPVNLVGDDEEDEGSDIVEVELAPEREENKVEARRSRPSSFSRFLCAFPRTHQLLLLLLINYPH